MREFTLKEFVAESNRIEGIYREPTEEEVSAHYRMFEKDTISINDMVEFVKVVQPDAELRDRMSVPGVRVGNHIAPPSGPDIRGNLQNILLRAELNWRQRMSGDPSVNDSPWRIHCDYETLHPFTDGNGRSGRALWLWCMGGRAPLGFLHQFYYQTLAESR